MLLTALTLIAGTPSAQAAPPTLLGIALEPDPTVAHLATALHHPSVD